MSISSALQWWEEWQLRILVLASLFVYYILNFSFTVRRLPNLRRLRVVIWIAYIGSDALAIYALATLFNRHKQTMMMLEGSVATATALEVVWAPVLLIHLGGHQTISAYSLEDNELWKRHVITFVSQVTVALYVFCKWWSGEKKLLQAAVLLFIVGIIKFGLKPWALKMASFNRMHMLDSTLVSLQSENISCNTDLVDIVVDMFGRGGGGGGEKDLPLKDYVRDARNCVLKDMHADSAQKTSDGSVCTNMVVGLEDIFSEGTNMMFVDMSAPYRVRLMVLQSFMKLEDAHDKLQQCLAHTFERLYSRMSSMNNLLGCCLRIVLTSLSIASVVLLAKSNKDGYDKNDVRVTYILYCGNLIMEFLPYFLSCLYMPFKRCRQLLFSRRWHNMVSQCSLLSFCARKKKPTILMKFATFICLGEYVNLNWYIQQVDVAPEITGLVRQHVIDGWKEHSHDDVGYKRFNNIRRFDNQLEHLGSVPFDHSVLLWHIATDLCFHYPGKSPQGDGDTRRSRSREISNYMIYLLSARPEMLLPGTRPDLFTLAGKEIDELFLKHSHNSCEAPLDKEDSLAREIINVVKSTFVTARCTLIRNACKLAEELMELGDEERWTVIQTTWVEMLCYSAVRCRGYLHAKSLGDGGECLTSIWLLWSFMGMETLADKLQRPEPSGGKADAGAPSTSRSQGAEIQSAGNSKPPG